MNKLWMRLWAVMLALCLAVTSVSTVEILKVYASEESDDGDSDDSDDDDDKKDDDDKNDDDEKNGDSDDDNDDDGPYPTGIITPTPEPTDTPTPTPEPTDTPTPTPEPPSPTDYDIAVYNANIDFGTIHEGRSSMSAITVLTLPGMRSIPTRLFFFRATETHILIPVTSARFLWFPRTVSDRGITVRDTCSIREMTPQGLIRIRQEHTLRYLQRNPISRA